MIPHRPRRCPLRKPRIWLWAMLVILPGHIVAAYALNWHKLGQAVVACPFPTPLRVALVPNAATPASLQAAAAAHTKPKPSLKATPTPPPRKTPRVQNARKQVQSPVPQTTIQAVEPAAGPTDRGAPIMGIQALGFQTPPSPPPYPARSRARGEEGIATILAQLAEHGGQPLRVKLEASSGFDALDSAALHATQSWQFNAPHHVVWVRLPVRFTLQ